MSKYVNSIYTTDQTGRLGGVVFGKNKFGYFLKVFKPPVNPRTVDQQTVRSFLSDASKEWAKLTPAQRTLWDSYASGMTYISKGSTYTLTGFLLFVKLNRNLQDIGSAFYKDIDESTLISPAGMNGSYVNVITTPGSEDIKLFIPASLDVNTKAIVCATKVLKSSAKPKWNLLRTITVIDSTFVTGGTIKADYIAKFGAMPKTGDLLGFSVMPVNIVCGQTNGKVYTTVVGTL